MKRLNLDAFKKHEVALSMTYDLKGGECVPCTWTHSSGASGSDEVDTDTCIAYLDNGDQIQL